MTGEEIFHWFVTKWKRYKVWESSEQWINFDFVIDAERRIGFVVTLHWFYRGVSREIFFVCGMPQWRFYRGSLDKTGFDIKFYLSIKKTRDWLKKHWKYQNKL